MGDPSFDFSGGADLGQLGQLGGDNVSTKNPLKKPSKTEKIVDELFEHLAKRSNNFGSEGKPTFKKMASRKK